MAAMTITAAVDGSALGNPGPAGWAWVVSATCWDAGGWPHGTNNMGELTAVLELLRATREAGLDGEPLRVLADSQYAINVISKWRHGWKKRGWQKADKKPIANLDIVRALDEAMAGRDVTFEWVRGHAGHPMNERADDLARAVAQAYQSGSPVPSGPGFAGRAGAGAAGERPGGPVGDSPVEGGREVDAADGDPRGPVGSGSGADEGGPTATVTPASAGTGMGMGTGTEAQPTPVTHSARPDASAGTDPSAGADASAGIRTGAADTGAGTSADADEVVDLEKAFLRAWFGGHDDVLAALCAPGATRVWADGRVRLGMAGPRPTTMTVGRITPAQLGADACLTTYRLEVDGRRSRESSVWVRTSRSAAPRLLFHQSTPLSGDSGRPGRPGRAGAGGAPDGGAAAGA